MVKTIGYKVEFLATEMPVDNDWLDVLVGSNTDYVDPVGETQKFY